MIGCWLDPYSAGSGRWVPLHWVHNRDTCGASTTFYNSSYHQVSHLLCTLFHNVPGPQRGWLKVFLLLNNLEMRAILKCRKLLKYTPYTHITHTNTHRNTWDELFVILHLFSTKKKKPEHLETVSSPCHFGEGNGKNFCNEDMANSSSASCSPAHSCLPIGHCPVCEGFILFINVLFFISDSM